MGVIDGDWVEVEINVVFEVLFEVVFKNIIGVELHGTVENKVVTPLISYNNFPFLSKSSPKGKRHLAALPNKSAGAGLFGGKITDLGVISPISSLGEGKSRRRECTNFSS